MYICILTYSYTHAFTYRYDYIYIEFHNEVGLRVKGLCNPNPNP